MNQVQIAELNFLFYDNCCQWESGALWVILASGIHASAFMPLLVKVVWETIQIIHQRFTLIPFKIINSQKKAAWQYSNKCLSMSSSRKPKPKNKSTCAEWHPEAHSRWNLMVVTLSLPFYELPNQSGTAYLQILRWCAVYEWDGGGHPSPAGWL